MGRCCSNHQVGRWPPTPAVVVATDWSVEAIPPAGCGAPETPTAAVVAAAGDPAPNLERSTDESELVLR